MRTRHRAALGAVLGASLLACATLAGVDELTIGECAGGACDGEEAGPTPERDGGTQVDGSKPDAALPPAACPKGEGPEAKRVGPADNAFCVDSTEVTFAQYEAFLDAGVDAAGQAAPCQWNTTFAPNAAAPADKQRPVTNVDWCDARAYCAWAGKHLCGKGEGGKKVGPVTEAELDDVATNQWLIACSAQTKRYPYGDVQDIKACNVGEYDAGKTLPVGSLPGCEGGYPGVFDMVGNVWEWFDGPCRPGDAGVASDECVLKGGGFANRNANIDCRVAGTGTRRDGKASYVGFRCCSE